MQEKRELDETDLEIVRLLAEDARRSFRDIADRVGLSPPAVSDRVDRLRDHGIIRRFTIDIDRSLLQHRTPILLELSVSPSAIGETFSRITTMEGVEQAYKTHDGTIVAHAAAPEDISSWLGEHLNLDAITDYTVHLLDEYAWRVEVAQADFSLECVVCGNAVSTGGITTEFDGDLKSFCCPSCLDRYETEYEARRESIS